VNSVAVSLASDYFHTSFSLLSISHNPFQAILAAVDLVIPFRGATAAAKASPPFTVVRLHE
jgi:hypothetical protein